MKLYYSKGACSLAVRIIIHELGLTSEYEAVDLHTKKTEKGTDFLTINPKGVVPALETDDKEIITENAVIQVYLADKNQAVKYLPPNNDIKRYRVLEWLNFIATELHKSFGPLFNPKIPNDFKDNMVKPQIKKHFKFANDAIKDKKFLLGDQFTLPDAYLFVMLYWLAYFKMDINEFPNLARYFNELKNRDSIVQSLKEEGLKI
jgi:glutathione S-transferase